MNYWSINARYCSLSSDCITYHLSMKGLLKGMRMRTAMTGKDLSVVRVHNQLQLLPELDQN